MIACVPTARLAVLHVAVRLLPLPASPTALQPPITIPLSKNCTLPDGVVPVTVAVNVTLPPATVGLAELAMLVVVEPSAIGAPMRTSSMNAVKSVPPPPIPTRVRVWAPVLAMLNGAVW